MEHVRELRPYVIQTLHEKLPVVPEFREGVKA
jgi:hypothetical protein